MNAVGHIIMGGDNATATYSEEQPWPFPYDESPAFAPFWFEKVDTYKWKQIMLRYPLVPWYACGCYLILIFSLQAFMRNKRPIKAKRALVAWNTFLAIFSAFGFYRIGSELLLNLQKPDGYYRSLCVREGRHLPSDFWGLMFALSKFMELGDTVFIVLRKQPLLLLQWYHHCLVTVFSWKLYPWGEPILSYYATINYGVHMFMYSYFALRGLNVKVPEPLAMLITSLQITQMIVNMFNNIYTIAMIHSGHPCSRHPTSISFSLFVYLSLAFLFAKFFFDRYYANQREKKLD